MATAFVVLSNRTNESHAESHAEYVQMVNDGYFAIK
jgi:hypothetical protein